MPFSARKMHFFDKNDNLTPCTVRLSTDVKELYFQLVFFYLSSEGFFPARSCTWLNPSLNIFNFAKNGQFLKDLRKKCPKLTVTIYIRYTLPKYIMIHGIYHIFAKNAQILVKNCNFLYFKNPHY